jgi:hypothetical protein
MSDNGYMIWFVATAAMIIAVLTIGTLAAAGLIGRDKTPSTRATESRDRGHRGHETTADNDAVASERRLETGPEDTDRGVHHVVHRARAHSYSGRQR